MSHAPVMLQEALAALEPRDGGVYLDATFGGGGYTRAILEAAQCEVVAIDRDPDAIARGRALEQEFAPRLKLVEGAFSDMEVFVPEPVDGVAIDLGVSSFQLNEAERGFSFMQDAPLDMRMAREGASAADAVNKLSEAGLADLLQAYGEEDEARRIARVLVQERAAAPIARTCALAAAVERAVGGRKGARLHPATKTFQALRMLVNDELAELARALHAAERILKPEGRLVIVSFHSLEDRMVKTFLAERSGHGAHGSRHLPDIPDTRSPSFRLVSRKTITPSEAEIEANPRARSASLRWAERTDAPPWDETPSVELAPRAREEWGRIA